MTDPRLDYYRPLEGRLVKIRLTFRPEVWVSGKLHVVETPEGSATPFAGFMLETEKGPLPVSIGEVRGFELLNTKPLTPHGKRERKEVSPDEKARREKGF